MSGKSFGNMIGRGLRKTGDELGKFGTGFSRELGINHNKSNVSIGESAGKASAVVIAAPFRFLKDVIDGARGSESADIVNITFPEKAAK